MVRLLPLMTVLLTLLLALKTVQPIFIPVHLLTFFVIAMVCHGELVRARPDPRDLTAFYLAMSLGGVLGGIFNALIAPFLFTWVVEYPLAWFLVARRCPPRVPAPGLGVERVLDLLLPMGVGLLTAAVLSAIPALH